MSSSPPGARAPPAPPGRLTYLLALCAVAVLAFVSFDDLASVFGVLGGGLRRAGGIPEDKERGAGARPAPVLLTTMLTDGVENYGEGAIKLIQSAKRSLPARYADVVVFSVLELEEKPLAPHTRARLAAAGWSFIVRKRIPPRDEAGTFPRFRDQFSKLHLWSMVEYERAIYLDSDCLVVGSISPLLELDVGQAPLWVTRDFRAGEWVETFNMGVFVIQPNLAEYDRLMSSKDTVPFETAMSEQGFLNVVYGTQWKEIGFENNANLVVYSHDAPYWASHSSALNVIHFTMAKPWECKDPYLPVCALWQKPQVAEAASLSSCPVTLVTGYFKMPSKHSEDEYREWMQSVLSLDACMVIYTTADLRPLFSERSPGKTVIRTVSLHEAARSRLGPSSSEFDRFWAAQLAADPERDIHKSADLYWVWNLKSSFLLDESVMNVFSSKHFFWMDIGCIRDGKYAGHKLDAPPHQLQSARGRLVIGSVLPFTEEELSEPTKTFYPDHVAGAVFGGDAQAVTRFSYEFHAALTRLAARGVFVGKDQTVISIVCLEVREFCAFVQGDPAVYEPWFIMVPFLLGQMPTAELQTLRK